MRTSLGIWAMGARWHPPRQHAIAAAELVYAAPGT
jgi:hypothetical protein